MVVVHGQRLKNDQQTLLELKRRRMLLQDQQRAQVDDLIENLLKKQLTKRDMEEILANMAIDEQKD